MDRTRSNRTESRRRARGKNYRKSAETEATIMEAAVSCLHEQGFHKLTLQNVAQRADMTRSAIQYYADTTQSLLLLLQEYLVDKIWGEELRQSLALPSGPTSHGDAIDIIHDHIDSRYFVAWNELLIAARTDDTLQPIVDRGNKLREEIHLRLADIFHSGADAERLRLYSALDDLFVLVLHGATFVSFADDTAERVANAKKVLRDLYVSVREDDGRPTAQAG